MCANYIWTARRQTIVMRLYIYICIYRTSRQAFWVVKGKWRLQCFASFVRILNIAHIYSCIVHSNSTQNNANKKHTYLGLSVTNHSLLWLSFSNLKQLHFMSFFIQLTFYVLYLHFSFQVFCIGLKKCFQWFFIHSTKGYRAGFVLGFWNKRP